jgi:ABC-2 type transport system ATP-binding protein
MNSEAVVMKNISKEFRVLNRHEGLKGSIHDLFSRDYRTVKAVDDVSLTVNRGEIIGYLGPNGAGKSTTIKIMTGVLEPSAGEIMVNGRVPYKDRTANAEHIGVVFGQRSQLWWNLPLIESFNLLRDIYLVPEKDYRDMLELYRSLVDLEPILHKPVRQMSLGQRMKGDLVAAMLHSPGVLFLDEPTIGLDVSAKYALRKFIKEINKVRKTTVILTTHDLGDIQELCERIIIINHGELMEDGNLNEIVDRIAPYKTLVVEYYDESAPEHVRCEMTEHKGNVAKYRFMKKDLTAAEIIADLSKEKTIKDVSIEETGIDDIIKIAYGT